MKNKKVEIKNFDYYIENGVRHVYVIPPKHFINYQKECARRGMSIPIYNLCSGEPCLDKNYFIEHSKGKVISNLFDIDSFLNDEVSKPSKLKTK